MTYEFCLECNGTFETIDALNDHVQREHGYAQCAELQSKLSTALEEKEAVRREWIEDRETTKAERNAALKERDTALGRLDSVLGWFRDNRTGMFSDQEAELAALLGTDVERQKS